MRIPASFLAFFVIGALAFAQQAMNMSVDQLMSFIRSSTQLKHDDRKVAEFLKKVKLTQKLSDRDIEEMMGFGAGARTISMLRTMQTAADSLPEPPKVEAKAAAPTIPPPSAEEQQKVLDQVTDYARNYVKQLPDFLCTQVTRRFFDPSGLEFWQKMDTITEKLSYAEKKESYQVVLVNDTPQTGMTHEQLGGTTSSGEFGTLIRDLFDPSARAEFAWERWGTIRKRRQHVYRYRVLQPNSKYSITWSSGPNSTPQTIIAGYSGYIYADADNNLITRMTLRAEDIPPEYPIQKVDQVLDYDFTKIGESDYLLPLKSVVKSRAGKILTKNELEFHNYRKFGTESVITFTPEPLPDSVTTEKPPQQP
jgi:hypothetical protein